MHFAYSRKSGEGSPTPEQMQRLRDKMSVPENELPAGVGGTVLLDRTDDAAVGITQVEAFSIGFRFTLAVRLRRARPDLTPGGLFMLVSSHVRPGVEVALENRLLVGLEYADGRRASTLQDMRRSRFDGEPDDDRLMIIQQGGGGGDVSVDQAYWVTPLPPDGPVTVVLSWPAFGMPESRAVLDGTAIRAAAEQSRLLWPPQPPAEPMEPPLPPAPDTGWFAEPAG